MALHSELANALPDDLVHPEELRANDRFAPFHHEALDRRLISDCADDDGRDGLGRCLLRSDKTGVRATAAEPGGGGLLLRTVEAANCAPGSALR